MLLIYWVSFQVPNLHLVFPYFFPSILYFIFYIRHSIFDILHSVFYILYSIFCILYSFSPFTRNNPIQPDTGNPYMISFNRPAMLIPSAAVGVTRISRPSGLGSLASVSMPSSS